MGLKSALGTGSANLVGQNFDGITVTLSAVNRTTGPNQLTTAQLNIDNTTNSVQVLKIIAGANGFLGNDSVFKLTGAIGATFGTSDLFGQFYADGGNTLNGTNFGVVGSLLNSFDSLSLTGPQSFSFNGFGSDFVNGPYGLAEELTLRLAPGAGVFVQGMSLEASAVPEPKTWAMLGIGFGLMALMGVKKSRKGNRLAALA